MPGTGTLINTLAVVGGGVAGHFAGRLFKEEQQDAICKVCGISVLFIAIAGAMEGMLQITMEETGKGASITSGRSMFIVLCLAIGTVIGELLRIEDGFERFGAWLKIRTGNAKDQGFVNGFVTASLTVCIGAMAIMGAIQDGISGDWSTLGAKSILDLIIIMVMTCSMGKGCMFSAVPVFLWEGGLTLLAGVIRPVMTDLAMGYLSFVGSVLIFCVGLNLEMGAGHTPGWSLAGLFDEEPLDPQQAYDGYRESDDHTLALHPENQSFFVENDLLCRWTDDEHTWANALLYIGESHVITIPYVVASVAPYTFAGASQVSELHFFIHVKGLGASGLSRKSAPEVLVLHLDENDEEPPLRLYPAPSISGMNPLNRSFSEIGLNIRALAFSCDRSLSYAKSEFARYDYEVRRLADGRFMDSGMEERFKADIQKSFSNICKEYAKRNDNSGFEALADAGFINAENASDVIEMVQELGNVAVTGYLLEMKSERFAHARIDFGL